MALLFLVALFYIFMVCSNYFANISEDVLSNLGRAALDALSLIFFILAVFVLLVFIVGLCDTVK